MVGMSNVGFIDVFAMTDFKINNTQTPGVCGISTPCFEVAHLKADPGGDFILSYGMCGLFRKNKKGKKRKEKKRKM